MYDQVQQELFAAGEMMDDMVAIPRVVGSLPPVEGFTVPGYDQVHQELVASSEMTVDIAEIPVVHQQVIVGMRPQRLVDVRGAAGGAGARAALRSGTSHPWLCCLGAGA